MQPDPPGLVDRVTPTVAEIHDRWIRSDWWGRAAGEHKVRAGDDYHVLEGLRHARQDIAALLARLAAYERLETAARDWRDQLRRGGEVMVFGRVVGVQSRALIAAIDALPAPEVTP